ncbi:hypothetical protein BDN72DRAFT_892197 [Pluteus cervinus]|uniref:Uncharacterized protein n=1 Tax=Pluteus cervinus TaxID=181527 RepID=A0ACD3BCY7_9AGAR|nr:hypothetical protein BDN72DRAFT_892197 [Pluteus cervinus]
MELVDHDEVLDLIAHTFSHCGIPSDSTPGHTILFQAQELVRSATASEDWTSPQRAAQRSIFLAGHTRQFLYARAPPRVQPGPIPALLEWGAKPDNTEIFALNDLDEFSSTDFETVLQFRPQLKEHKVRKYPPTAEAPASKRLKLDTSSLHGVIPQPHFYPAPYQSSFNPPKIPAFNRTKPIPLQPNILPLLPPQYQRWAWIVPIRGSLPWPASTPAVLVQESEAQLVHSESREPPHIMWTHGSIAAFWAFLASLRQTCNIGPLGLSLHLAQSQRTTHQESSDPPSNNGFGQIESADVAQLVASLNSQAACSARRVELPSADYIKVYHDAPFSMHLRNALHVWTFSLFSELQDGATGDKTVKLRILKGARLVLVDHRSRGLLIS